MIVRKQKTSGRWGLVPQGGTWPADRGKYLKQSLGGQKRDLGDSDLRRCFNLHLCRETMI